MSEHCHSNCGCYTLVNGALWGGDCALPAALKQLELFKKAEYDLSNAYLRLRKKLRAFDTPYAPTGEQVWSHTEQKLDEALEAIRRLQDALAPFADKYSITEGRIASHVLKETEQWGGE